VIDFIHSNLSTIIEIVILSIAAIITSVSAFILLQLTAQKMKTQYDLYRAARKAVRMMSEERDSHSRMKEWKIYRYIDFLLQSTTEATDKTTQRFVVMLFTIFGTSFVILQATSIRVTWWGGVGDGGIITGILFRFVLSFVIAFLPVLYYILKLRLIRIGSGYDLANTSGILLSKYRKTNGRIYDALLETAEGTKNIYIKRRLFRIVKAAQTYVDSYDLKREIDIFVFSINTTFARQIGVAIQKGFSKSMDIEQSLEATDKALQLNIQMLNDEKSSNHDILQLGWVHLFAFPLSIWAATKFIPFERFWQFQFETESGRLFLILSIISVLGSVFVALWFRKPPNDI